MCSQKLTAAWWPIKMVMKKMPDGTGDLSELPRRRDNAAMPRRRDNAAIGDEAADEEYWATRSRRPPVHSHTILNPEHHQP